jgi:predicted nucleotidyltransferase component of viral defense system
MLREETVEPSTLELLKKLAGMPVLKEFRLVGGTALSLLYGHRKSIDLDFFIDKPLQKDELLNMLENEFQQVQITNNRSASILQCIVNYVKLDFVSVKDPFNYPANVIDDILLADIKDLVALKLNAVKGRGAKKDFWDIAKLLEFYKLDDLFKFYTDRYPYDDTFAVIRSVIYFDDADNDLDPETIDKITWVQVKKRITLAFDDYIKRI